jgi:hypothetical protein
MEKNFYQQLTDAMRLAYKNAQKIIAVENKQKPFTLIELKQTTIQICNN